MRPPKPPIAANTYRSGSAAVLGLVGMFILLPWITVGLQAAGGESLTVCRYKQLSGRPCPTCGMTRGIRAALAGRWQQAAEWNRLAPVAMLLGVVELLYRGIIVLWPAVARRMTQVCTADIILHAALIFALLTYTGLFFAGVIPPSAAWPVP